MAAPLLEVHDLVAGYGGEPVLRDVSFNLGPGQLLLVIGPNGAGKSTLLRTLIGLHRATSGKVLLNGRRVDSLSAHHRARAGMAWIPETRGIVGQLTVEDNLDLARFGHAWKPEMRPASLERFPLLARALHRPAGTLSGGEQQMLAIARALETGSQLLMIDEPSLGLAPKIVEEVMDEFVKLRAEGRSILLVEQRAAQVQHVADAVLLIRAGRVEPVRDRNEARLSELSFEVYAGAEAPG